MTKWCSQSTGSSQTIIYDQHDGRTIAVAYYDEMDGPLIAASPEMLQLLRESRDFLCNQQRTTDVLDLIGRIDSVIHSIA